MLSAQPVPRGSSRQSAPGTARPTQAALPRATSQTLGTAVPRAHLALVTGPSTTDGMNCGPHFCAESRGESSRHRSALCREPVSGSRHRRGVRWPLTEVGPTSVPPGSPSMPRAKAIALGTEPALPRAWALALGTDYFFSASSWLPSSLIHHHILLIFIPGS
jgi:hypothetical protein